MYHGRAPHQRGRARGASRRREADLQQGHGGLRHLHQRHLPSCWPLARPRPAGGERGRSAPRPSPAIAARHQGRLRRRSPARLRPTARASTQARDRQRAGRRQRRRRRRRCPRDCQLAAGQDRRLWPRRKLGARGRGRSASAACPFDQARRLTSTIMGVPVCRAGLTVPIATRTTRCAASRHPRSASTSTCTPGGRPHTRLDLRPHARLRHHQRRLPHVADNGRKRDSPFFSLPRCRPSLFGEAHEEA